MRKISIVANRNTHVHDATGVNNISDSDRFQQHVDFTDQTLVTVASSSHDNYAYDDVTNVSNFKVAELGSQFYANEKAESYLFNHEFDVVDSTCYVELTQSEEHKSHVSQPQSEEQNAHVDNVSIVNGMMHYFNQSDRQELNSLIKRLHYVNNDLERYESQCGYEEVESHLPSDDNEVIYLVYNEEESYEGDDESGFSNYSEEKDIVCSPSYESDFDWEEESNDGSEHSSEAEGMNSSSDSEKESASQFLCHTNQLANEEIMSDLSSKYEDKKMLSPVNESDFEDSNEELLNAFTSHNKYPPCSVVFRNDSQCVHNGYPKQVDKEDVTIDTICLVEEIEKESLYSSDFSSYAESFHEDRVDSKFQVYNNILYDDACEDEQPMVCPNV
jgi:hypothetical protein